MVISNTRLYTAKLYVDNLIVNRSSDKNPLG